MRPAPLEALSVAVGRSRIMHLARRGDRSVQVAITDCNHFLRQPVWGHAHADDLCAFCFGAAPVDPALLAKHGVTEHPDGGWVKVALAGTSTTTGGMAIPIRLGDQVEWKGKWWKVVDRSSDHRPVVQCEVGPFPVSPLEITGWHRDAA